MDIRKKKHRYKGVLILYICIFFFTMIILSILQLINNREANLIGQDIEGIGKSAADSQYNKDSEKDIPVSSIRTETADKLEVVHAEEPSEEAKINASEEKAESATEVAGSVEAVSRTKILSDEEVTSTTQVAGLQDDQPEGMKEPNQNTVSAHISEDSETIKVLRLFYKLLTDEQYDKAYGLLDEKFKLSAFKVLGASEISKRDIDLNTFSEFLKALGILKVLKIDRIVFEKIEDKNQENVCQIYYYQSFSIENIENVTTPLVVSLKKSSNGWKIAALEDGDPTSLPYK